jgi:AraC family ethanolamine operon transcriptional activator
MLALYFGRDYPEFRNLPPLRPTAKPPPPGAQALVLDCFDPEAMAGALQHGSLDHTQLASGRFRGRVERSGSTGTRLDWGRYNLPLLVSGRVAPDCLSLGYLRSARGVGSFNGQPVQAGDLAVLGENEEIYLRLPPHTEWIAMQLPRDGLVAFGLECRDRIPEGVWRPTPGARALLERTVQSVSARLGPAARAEAGSHPEELGVAHDELLGALLEALRPEGTPSSEPATPGRRMQRMRIVRRAQEYAEARLGEPVRMAELCAAAGASLASLERAFADLHGMSPKRFLTLQRLSHARRTLISGSGLATVTDAATASGFFHLGRFAEQYKAFFHEPPSATLRLARAA